MLETEAQQIRQMILNELPKLMQNDTAFRESVISIAQFQFADKAETDNRFDQMMTLFKRFMDEDRKKWDETQRQIAALNTEIKALYRRLEQDQKKWDETQRQIAALNTEIKALYRRLEQDQKKWDENQRRFDAMNAEIKELNRRLEQKIEQDQKKWDENQRQIATLNADIKALNRRLEQKIEQDQKKWDENQRRFDAVNAEIKALNRRLEQKIEEDRQKWLEYQQKLDRFMDEERKKWDENQKRWDENQKQLAELRAENQKQFADFRSEFEAFSRKHNQSIGALGSRWGSQSEASFREALAGILKDFQEIKVINVIEWDENGAVFGHPDQIELDIIIKNGVLIVCELKSSVNKSDMYTFERKVRFYEQKRAKSVSRMLIISPFVDKHAMPIADKLGIEVYSYADDVDI
jgi:hypothetical protein